MITMRGMRTQDRRLTEEARVKARQLCMDHCMRCHGVNAVSNKQVPDLRRLDPRWHTNFQPVVREGMTEGAGMPSFEEAQVDLRHTSRHRNRFVIRHSK